MSLIDAFIRRKQSTPKPRPKGVLYVTDITKPCLRQAYFGVVSPRGYPIETLRIFEAGNVLEDFWDDVLVGSDGVTVLATQLPAWYFEDDLEIHGRVDVLAQHGNGELMVHEVKSAKSAYWMNAPRDNHVLQIQFYMGVLLVEKGRIDYLDKEAFVSGENAVDISFHLTRNPNVFYWLLGQARTLKEAVDRGEEPEADPSAWNGRVCEYCQFGDICEREEP